MLFFQAALLAGYAYAHGLVTRFPPRRQALIHLGLLALAVGVLAGRALLTGSPVAPGLGWRPSGVEGLTGRLLAMLAVTIGLPFFVLSTSAPLLQSWFARARPGTSPYRLYALSNAGSLLGLLSYPFLVEPLVPRSLQGWAWGAGFLVFAAGCAVCAWDMKGRTRDAAPAEAVAEDTGQGERPGAGRTALWLGLSACASVLLLATTNQLSQDVAAGPFLWVLPLAIYLLTFILAFEREALYSRAFFSLLLVVAVGGVTRVVLEGPHTPLVLQLLAYCGALLAGCMVCHGELYRLRPAPRYLSAFFLCVSIGGVLGGAFVSLVAPHLFLTFAEYPLALTACCLVALVAVVLRPTGEELTGRWRRMLRIFMLAFVVVGLGVSVVDFRREIRLTARNFFGVVQVLEQGRDDATKHRFTLKHGAIVHGVQYTEPERRKQPMSYFTRESGLGLAIAEHRRLREVLGLPEGLRIGVLGLGIGSSAALAQEGDRVRFYEINPKIISLAQGEGGYFSYLSDATARIDIVEGDARIALEQELERQEPQGFDVLAVDVFSSDSIPVHLLTEEAVAVYRQHLAPHGVLALHISNAHLDLVPITLAHAQAFRMHATLVVYEPKDASARSVWVILSPDAEFSWGSTFREAVAGVRRLELEGPPSLTWTDERGSVLPLLRRGGWVSQAREVLPPRAP